MNKIKIPRGAAILGLALAAPSLVEASHFRGGAMVPSVAADGTLTVDVTTFWRTTFVSTAFPNVSGSTSGGISISQTSISTDTSDSRFTVRSQTFKSSSPVSGAQTFTVSWSGCCRIAGINNASASSWSLSSEIAWDGSSTAKPIDFNFASIQPEVVRSSNYNDSLGATSPTGDTLSYDQALALNINSQPPGFTIDPTTGAMHIPATSTATYLDNLVGQPGGDYAFSGNIFAENPGSGQQTGRVQFDWMFDAVNTGATNTAPTVADALINAIVGDTVTHTFMGTDPDGDPLTWTFAGQLGSTPAIAPTFDPLTQQYVWDTTGSSPGTYIAQARASDGLLTDTGNLTIHVSAPVTHGVPDSGSTVFALGSALLGLFGFKRLAKRASQRRG
jgi:hypothetical protein